MALLLDPKHTFWVPNTLFGPKQTFLGVQLQNQHCFSLILGQTCLFPRLYHHISSLVWVFTRRSVTTSSRSRAHMFNEYRKTKKHWILSSFLLPISAQACLLPIHKTYYAHFGLKYGFFGLKIKYNFGHRLKFHWNQYFQISILNLVFLTLSWNYSNTRVNI